MSNVRQTSKWRRFMQLDGSDKWLLLRATGWLLIARMLLKRYGHASTIHFGVERAGDEVLNGHAWLTCGETVVTGGRSWIATSKCTVSALDRAVFDTHHHIYKFLGAVFSLDREMAPQETFQTNASHKLVEVEYLALPVPS